MRWYRLAAEHGHVGAQFQLELERPSVRDVPRDDAVKRYRLAAEQGDAFAQLRLGIMYAAGTGVPQDDAKAVY